jgi:phage terminase large subunit-like protein
LLASFHRAATHGASNKNTFRRFGRRGISGQAGLAPECCVRNDHQRRARPGPRRQLKPAKDKSTERIDGIVALIMAIGRAMVAQDEPQPEYSLFFV